MAITTKYCQKELEEYGGCVVSHPASWQEKCLDLKLKVAQCTSSQYVQMSCLQINAFTFVCGAKLLIHIAK